MVGGPNCRLDLGGPGGGDPEPPGEDSARVANSSHGPTGGGRRKEGDDYRLKDPISACDPLRVK